MPPAVVPLDIVFVGSGVAGLTGALRALSGNPGIRVGVVAKAELSASATVWAQGGVAAVLSDDEISIDARDRDLGDSAALHVADTLAAGAGLCDLDAVEILTQSGPQRVRELMALGASFDRDTDGVLELAREGGHSVPRVVHAGGAATGAEVERVLVDAVRASAATLWEGWFATGLIVEDGRCRGVRVLTAHGAPSEVRAAHTVLATGGAGQMFSVTTNPSTSTGDGVAMALRAGVAVADLEFVQFHPTALHHPVMPRPLLSEALRGEGALLVDDTGERFVDELLPRDVVSRAMTTRMLDANVDHLWLDVRHVPGLAQRFATVVEAVTAAGFDPLAEWLPVAPAAHYLCGGVVVDLDGATSLPGLWAAGEVACTGVHGANRLASNSLLEGLVFAARAVDAIAAGHDGPGRSGALGAVLSGRPDRRGIGAVRLDRPNALVVAAVAEPGPARHELQRSMSVGAGVVRSAASLEQTRRVLETLAGAGGTAPA
ncbi:MAG: FAD-binding protein, partial [Actinomycetota bacterium]|nr:FAD-binding protein [Actinomycetota bacterium]